MWPSPFLPRAHPGTVFGLWTTQGRQERIKDLPFYLQVDQCIINLLQWLQRPRIWSLSQQVFRRMTPVAGGLGLSLVIVGGFFAFYFIVVTRFKDSKCFSSTFTIAKCHLSSFKQSLVLLWSNTLKYRSTFNTPSWSIWYLAASLDPSGLPWVRYSNFCDNFKI